MADDKRNGEQHPTVAKAYGRFVAARLGRYDQGRDTEGALHRDNERQLWQAARDALRAYHRPDNSEPFPQEIAHWLADAADELLTGRLPESMSALQRAGTPAASPRLRGDMEAAVLYVRAASREGGGLVKDRSPVRTVATEYDIADETYPDWRKKYRDSPATDPKAFRPDLDNQTRGRLITALMKKSAESYRQFRKTRDEEKPA